MKKILVSFLIVLTLFPSVAFGATTFMESGGDATKGIEFWPGTQVNSPTTDSTVSHTGPSSIKLSRFAQVTKASILADAGRRISMWVRFSSVTPPSSSGGIRTMNSGSVASIFGWEIKSTGKLALYAPGLTDVNGNTVLSANTWYRVSMSYYITNATTFTCNLYLNGVLEATMNSGTLTNISTDTLEVYGTSEVGATAWYDDIYVDNGASSGSQTDTGDIWVTAKRPFANGTTNGFSSTGSPSGYGTGNAQYVNERPLNTSNFVSVLAAGVTTEEYNIEDVATGDVNLNGQTLVDYAGWLYAKAALAETGSMVINNATSNVSLTSSNTLFENYAGSTSYPARTGTDIGIVTTGLATTVTLYEGGMLFAYKPVYFNPYQFMDF